MRSVRGADGVTLVRSAWGGSWSAQSVVERGVHRFSTQVVKRLEPTLVWFSRQLLCCRLTALCQPPPVWPLIDQAVTAQMRYGLGIDKAPRGLDSGLDHAYAGVSADYYQKL